MFWEIQKWALFYDGCWRFFIALKLNQYVFIDNKKHPIAGCFLLNITVELFLLHHQRLVQPHLQHVLLHLLRHLSRLLQQLRF